LSLTPFSDTIFCGHHFLRHHGDTAIRLAAALGTSERFWLGLQGDYDLEAAHLALGDDIAHIEQLAA